MNKIKTNKKVNNINMKLVIAFCIISCILVIPVTVLAEDAAGTAASTEESTQANDSSGVESSSSQTGSTNSTESSGTNDSTASNNSEPTPVNDTESSNDSAPSPADEAPASEGSDDNPESQPSDDNPAESQTTAEPEITPQSDNLNDSEQAEPTDSNDANSGPDGDEGETGDSGNSNSVGDTPVSEDPTTPQSTPDEESAPAENTTVGNSYTAEVTSERVVGTGKEDTSFTVSFMEVGEHTPLGSVQMTLPDGFSDLSLVEGSIQASDGKSWTGGVVDLVLSLWAQNADSYLDQGESVDVTFTATTPTETGVYTFGTEAWTDASTDFDDIGTITNNMAAGYSDPTVGVFEINSPVQISTVDELELLSDANHPDDLAKYYEQTADIDFSTKYTKNGSGEWPGWNEGKGWSPIGNNSYHFTGTYDGGGYTISNLFIDRTSAAPPSNSNLGLFGYTDATAVLQNIKLVDVEIKTATVSGNDGRNVGGLVGFNMGSIKNSSVSGTVEGIKDIGGLAGLNGGTIENSSADVDVTGKEQLGGLVGQLDGGGTIDSSSAAGDVTGTGVKIGGLVGYNLDGTVNNSSATGNVSGDADVGGLVGTNNADCMINSSYANGNVKGTGTADTPVGGLVGVNAGTIEKSYATGKVTGRTLVGGLVGYNVEYGMIDSSYATGIIEGTDDNVGGLVGSNDDSTVKNSYATGSVTGGNYVGGLVGRNVNSGTIENSYATGNVTGTDNIVGGLVGSNGSGASAGNITKSYWNLDAIAQGVGNGDGSGASGKTIADIQTIAFHKETLGWDITGQDGFYPNLGWEVNWSANTWYMGTPPAPDNTNGGSFGGGFGFFDFEFTPGLAFLAQNGSGLTTLTGQGNAPIAPGIIASGNWNDLNQAVAAYQAALVALENNITTLSPAELALIEVELAIARAAILALEAKLLAADGKPFNLANLQAAYAAAVAAFNANQSFLSTDQQAAANQLFTAIAGVIAALE